LRSQQQIFQEISDMGISAINDDWLEFIISYNVEGTRSKEINTFIKRERGKIVEKSIPFMPELNKCLRELREHLSSGGKPEFTSCKLHFKSNGEFDASYGYEPVKWSLAGGWNFNIS
jgi:hypothetical protein